MDWIRLDKIGDALMYRDQKLETMETRSVRGKLGDRNSKGKEMKRKGKVLES